MNHDPFNQGREPWNFSPEHPQLDSVRVSDVLVRVGDRVRLWPLNRADIMDMALEGKLATVEAIEQDFEDRVHLAVVVDDDPGRDLGMLRQIGHRFFFAPAEVEPLGEAESADCQGREPGMNALPESRNDEG
jgi:hypothetical protein